MNPFKVGDRVISTFGWQEFRGTGTVTKVSGDFVRILVDNPHFNHYCRGCNGFVKHKDDVEFVSGGILTWLRLVNSKLAIEFAIPVEISMGW